MKTKFYLVIDFQGWVNYIYYNGIAFRFNCSFMRQRMSEQEIEMLKTNVIPQRYNFINSIQEITRGTAEKIILDNLFCNGNDIQLKAEPYLRSSALVETESLQIVTGNKKCLNCGNDFTPENTKGKFCSLKCRVAF